MDKVLICGWLERLLKVTKYLRTKSYVVLNDVDLYDTWIEFKRKKN